MKKSLISLRIRAALRFAWPMVLAIAGTLHAQKAIPEPTSNESVEITSAQKDQALVQPNSDAYEREVARLRKQEEKDYDFDRAILSDVLRALATDAKLNYLALPESKEAEQTLVTIHLKQAPFVALETVANAYGVALIYEGGVWHMRPFDDKQVIARNYRLKYNLTEEVNISQGFGGGMSSMGGMGGGGAAGGGSGGSMGSMGMGGAGGGSTGGGGGTGGGAIGIGSGTSVGVQKQADVIMENLKSILGIPTKGFNALVAPETDVGSFQNSPLMVPLRSGVESDSALRNEKDQEAKSAVAWNSDNNSFFVVATRQQHQWVEAYLTSLDKVQSLIAVEMKFFETTRDPRSQMGIDWSQTLDGGFQLSTDGLGKFPALDLNESLASQVLAPQSVLLNTSELKAKLQFLSKDRDSQFTSYPRVLTLNNRPVTFQSVINQPILASSSSVTPGVGGTSTQSVAYMPIGTSIVLVPKKLDEGRINMHVQIIVSNIVGSEIVGGNKYPVPSTRLFQDQVQVQDGYSIAIAGLDETLDTREGTGIPLLSKIPLAGWLFKNRFHDRTKKSMMIFITPTLVDADGRGVSEKPLSELPRFRGDLPVDSPKIYTDGTLVGGPAKLAEAVRWAEREQRQIKQAILEGNGDQTHKSRIALLNDVIDALRNYLPACTQMIPAETLALYRNQLDQLDGSINDLRVYYRKHHMEGLGYKRTSD
jgi:hypothetical protein